MVVASMLVGLYLTSLYSYLLFHSLAEIFTVVVGFAIFILAWNTRRLLDNGYLLWVGLAYLFVNTINIFHTLAYKGMGIFPQYDANLPTQLWVGGQYLNSLSLLVAPLFLSRKLRIHLVLIGYTIVTVLLLASIFGGAFPDCYLEGVGLTPFKKNSEYLISFIYLASIALLLQKRRYFDKTVLRLLVSSIVFSTTAELAFTFYIDVYGLSNLIGHLLRIISFYLMYKAIVETGLVKPFNLLFRDLKQSEETLRQYTDQLQERNRDLDAFAHTAAHDLKGPLNTISLSAEVLSDYSTLSESERADSLKAIRQMAFKMNNIIDELLLLSQMRQAEVQLRPLDMVAIINETQQRLTAMIEASNGAIIVPDRWPVALGHAAWVEEVWVNYISNAIKYGNKPPRVELGATLQPDGMIRFWVRDNGPGLSPQQQAKLFTPFTQLTHVRATGYGLGLSIVARIVEKLGGQVGVESKGIDGQGSLFYFTLPGLSVEVDPGQNESVEVGDRSPLLLSA
jgi:signal transduction histidine kinase